MWTDRAGVACEGCGCGVGEMQVAGGARDAFAEGCRAHSRNGGCGAGVGCGLRSLGPVYVLKQVLRWDSAGV